VWAEGNPYLISGVSLIVCEKLGCKNRQACPLAGCGRNSVLTF
jgi:hypothetical protein